MVPTCPDSDRPNRLAIVGASVRSAAQSAQRAGFDAVGADLFADVDSRAVGPVTKIDDYPEGLVDWLESTHTEGRIDAWMYTGALENYPELVDRMAAIAPLWGVSGESLRRCRDPLVLQREFTEAGALFPETLPAAEARDRPGRWVAKTYRHSGGVGVWPIDSSDDWDRAADAYAQRFVEGRSLAALYAITRGGAALLGVTEQLKGDDPRDWGYAGSLGPIRVGDRLAESLDRIGAALAERFELRGLVGVDLMVDRDAASVVEINPRYTASVEALELACGRSALAAHRDACQGQPLESWPVESERVVAKRVLFARRQLTVGDAFADWALAQHAAERLADCPHAGEVIAAGRPVCSLLLTADDEPAARAELTAALAEAEQRLYAADR